MTATSSSGTTALVTPGPQAIVIQCATDRRQARELVEALESLPGDVLVIGYLPRGSVDEVLVVAWPEESARTAVKLLCEDHGQAAQTRVQFLPHNGAWFVGRALLQFLEAVDAA